MKPKIIFAFLVIILVFNSCKKCETCTAYHFDNGVLGAVDTRAQAIKLCDKTDITSYENLVGFTDEGGDTAKFVCH